MLKWDFDLKIAKIMNEVAEEMGIDSKQVKEVLTCHMDSLRVALSDKQLPQVPLVDRAVGNFKPVPVFISRKIKSLRSKGTDSSIKWADELEVVLERVLKEKSLASDGMKKRVGPKKNKNRD